MYIPEKVRRILCRLEEQGHQAYVVGGCVRDTLLGFPPGDWDICTDALPEETMRCFRDRRVIPTGIRFGTVTVAEGEDAFEITTFRRDGTYADHRKPLQVTFTASLREDLSRRDFTVNAMAAAQDGVLIDLFGGQEDLKNGIIRCVGDPDSRMEEDALRILRALRFASRLQFSVDSETSAAMTRKRELLTSVSGERVYKELTGLLTGPGAAEILREYAAALLPVLPEIGPAMGFWQYNPNHDRDVWEHTVAAVGFSEADAEVRWALLLHDLGKPDRFTRDENGEGHFRGHPARSEELARGIFARLRADRETTEAVCTLVRHHDDQIRPEKTVVRRWIGRYGPELLEKLLAVMRADILAHRDTEQSRDRYRRALEFTDLVHQVLKEESCFAVRDLAVSGSDVMAMGVPAGPRVGQILRSLLSDVLEERCANTSEALLDRLREMLTSEEGESHAD